jgi:hypothetical protein
MASVEFDRQAFVQPAKPPQNSVIPLLGLLAVALAVAGAVYIGFKFISAVPATSRPANAEALDQIQQQLSEIDKRIDQLEKRRKTAAPAVAPTKETPINPVVALPSKRPGYKIFSARPAQPELISQMRVTPPPLMTNSVAAVQTNSRAADATTESADREAWQATTDRLGDVVGVVGSQQGEITQTREDVNKLLSQNRRTAMQFELRRGAGREPVGPVSLVLKGSDPKNHRYSVCVYVQEQCIELKDRAVDEVVVFVLTPNSAPLELVATKILHDQIVGYLEVPQSQTTQH